MEHDDPMRSFSLYVAELVAEEIDAKIRGCKFKRRKELDVLNKWAVSQLDTEWEEAGFGKDVQKEKHGNDCEWEDCTMGIKCGCGSDELIVVDSQNEPVRCAACGREFYLSVTLMTKKDAK